MVNGLCTQISTQICKKGVRGPFTHSLWCYFDCVCFECWIPGDKLYLLGQVYLAINSHLPVLSEWQDVNTHVYVIITKKSANTYVRKVHHPYPAQDSVSIAQFLLLQCQQGRAVYVLRMRDYGHSLTKRPTLACFTKRYATQITCYHHEQQ